MRLSQDEKIEIINLVENSDLSANRTLKELGIHKRTYYSWYKRYLYEGIDGLAPKAKGRQQTWNKIPPEQRSEVIEEAHWNTKNCRQGNLPVISSITINGSYPRAAFTVSSKELD